MVLGTLRRNFPIWTDGIDTDEKWLSEQEEND